MLDRVLIRISISEATSGDVSLKKRVLKNFANFTENRLCWSLVINCLWQLKHRLRTPRVIDVKTGNCLATNQN